MKTINSIIIASSLVLVNCPSPSNKSGAANPTQKPTVDNNPNPPGPPPPLPPVEKNIWKDVAKAKRECLAFPYTEWDDRIQFCYNNRFLLRIQNIRQPDIGGQISHYLYINAPLPKKDETKNYSCATQEVSFQYDWLELTNHNLISTDCQISGLRLHDERQSLYGGIITGKAINIDASQDLLIVNGEDEMPLRTSVIRLR